MVQTVQQIIEISQLQFVARWSTSPVVDVDAKKTAEILQLQINKGFHIPVVAPGLVPRTVLRTIQTPPVARAHGDRCPCCACRAGSLPCRGAKADPHDQAVQQTTEI